MKTSKKPPLTVELLIRLLSKEVKKCDRQNARIEVWCGEKEYEIEDLREWSMSPDIVFKIKPVESALLRPMVFKKEHSRLVKKIERKIRKCQLKN
jgi:hypothetical protein